MLGMPKARAVWPFLPAAWPRSRREGRKKSVGSAPGAAGVWHGESLWPAGGQALRRLTKGPCQKNPEARAAAGSSGVEGGGM